MYDRYLYNLSFTEHIGKDFTGRCRRLVVNYKIRKRPALNVSKSSNFKKNPGWITHSSTIGIKGTIKHPVPIQKSTFSPNESVTVGIMRLITPDADT